MSIIMILICDGDNGKWEKTAAKCQREILCGIRCDYYCIRRCSSRQQIGMLILVFVIIIKTPFLSKMTSILITLACPLCFVCWHWAISSTGENRIDGKIVFLHFHKNHWLYENYNDNVGILIKLPFFELWAGIRKYFLFIFNQCCCCQ